jgi:branched-chain amino acid transport system substrate-binding protein
MIRKIIQLLAVVVCLPLLTAASSDIKIGMSGSLSGHFGPYGEIIKHGIMTAFQHVNNNGGIKGKNLTLVCMDDQGDAEKTEANIKKMYHDGINLFVGVMGTRGILATLPLIQQKKIGMMCPWGGHEKFRDPTLTHIINGPGLLEPQANALSNYIVDTLQLSKIAIFHADDSFSTFAAEYLVKQLTGKNIKNVQCEAYNRFTLDITKPSKKLMQYDPKAIICIATSMPTVKLINILFQNGYYGTKFFGIDSTFLVPHTLKLKGSLFNYTACVPNPTTSTIPLAIKYCQDIKTYFPSEPINPLSFTYYLAGRVIAQALINAQTPQNLDAVMAYITELRNTTLDGFPLNFNPSNRHLFGTDAWII